MHEDDIVIIGANEGLFDEEERVLSRPITGRSREDEDAPERDDPTPAPAQKKDRAVTSATFARAAQQFKKEQKRIQPAYDHIEQVIERGIIDGDEESVVVDLGRFTLSETDIGKIKDSYAVQGWKIEVGAEPFALTFALPS